MQKLSPWGFIGMGVLACDLFLYGASATFAPLWLVAMTILLWLLLMGLATRWFSARPMWTFWVSIVGVLLWMGEIALAAAVK